jgi:hypothetical protein
MAGALNNDPYRQQDYEILLLCTTVTHLFLFDVVIDRWYGPSIYLLIYLHFSISLSLFLSFAAASGQKKFGFCLLRRPDLCVIRSRYREYWS